jgi:voltage-gated potassium channel
MSAGVGLFGTFSGLLASWFIGAEEESSDGDLVALREEIAALRELIERDLSTKASG